MTIFAPKTDLLSKLSNNIMGLIPRELNMYKSADTKRAGRARGIPITMSTLSSYMEFHCIN